MTIHVRYFASLRESMGHEEENVGAEGMTTVQDLWEAVARGKPLPERVLCAINMEYVDIRATVRDGDEVAFFPPVTGG